MYSDFTQAYKEQANLTANIIAQRWPHPSTDIFLAHPILLPQHKLNTWAKVACDIADLLSNVNTHSKGIAELNKSLHSDTPDCFSVDFAIVKQNGELGIKLIEAQAFPSVMSLMLDFEDIFNPKSELCGLNTADRRTLFESTLSQQISCKNLVMLDENITAQSSANDFMSSLHLASTRSILDIYQHGSEWIHWRDNGPMAVKRVYNRSIFHTLNTAQQTHILNLLDHKDITFFNHPAWYYKVDKASLGRIAHWSIPKTYPITSANNHDMNNMVLKHPNGFGGKEVFISPSKEDIKQAPIHSILQERIEYAAFHPALTGDDKLCVELRFMLLRTNNSYTPITTLARATVDGNLMRYRENKLPGEGYTCAIGVGENPCSV